MTSLGTAYTRSLSKSTSSTAGSIVLAAMNASSIVSRTGVGVLSDRFRPHVLGAVLLIVGAVSILALWGGAGATGLPALVAFAAVFGLSAGGWTSIFFAVARECSNDLNGTVLIYGALSFTRGLGNILCSVIGSKLLLKPFDAPAGSGFGIDDDAYSSLILFCATCCATSGLIEVVLVKFSSPKKRSE